MLPGSDSMGAPSSFSSRRPNASHLPQFELPPPQLPAFGKYSQSYSNHQQGLNTTIPTSLTSVGNLLTPPSGSSIESPTTSTNGVPTANAAASTQPMAPYTPGGYSWSQTATAPSYGYQSSMSPSAFAPSKGLFSTSVNSLGKSNNSSNTNELPPPPYGSDMSSYGNSMPLSAPISLPAMNHHHHHHQGMSSGHGSMSSAVTQPSPLSQQGSFSRPPPTPTYSYSSHSSSAPAQTPFPYSAGPSPIQQSPVSAQGHIPSLHQQHSSQSPYASQRGFSYPLPGPVLSNIGNPNGQLAMVGGMPHGMVSGYNSGHAAQMQQMYGHGAGPNGQAANDRPFKCDQCPQSFNRNHDLKRHKRIHLAVKPFPCGHCDKSFSRKDALKRHILVKGCGKAHATGADGATSDASNSPTTRSEVADSSPVIPASV